MTDLSSDLCRKSTHSTEKRICVELTLNVPGIGAKRDSKAPEQGALVLSSTHLRGLLAVVKPGRFDRW
ncbi:DUF397 domain-containing protein [Saccharopolyspora sp. NPDC000995]